MKPTRNCKRWRHFFLPSLSQGKSGVFIGENLLLRKKGKNQRKRGRRDGGVCGGEGKEPSRGKGKWWCPFGGKEKQKELSSLEGIGFVGKVPGAPA